jgi:hypothetical protein
VLFILLLLAEAAAVDKVLLVKVTQQVVEVLEQLSRVGQLLLLA